jgi:hypothetical protein
MAGNKRADPPADMLCSALNGDNLAMEQLLSFYDSYISKFSILSVRDGNSRRAEENKQIISIEFIKGVRNFAKLLLDEKAQKYPDKPCAAPGG